jgi:hypothetical protein
MLSSTRVINRIPRVFVRMSCIIPPYKDVILTTHIEKMNKIDKIKEYNDNIKDLSKWEPFRHYKDRLQHLNEHAIDEIHYMYVMCSTPGMSPTRRQLTRNRLYDLYKQAKTDIEKELIFNLMNYYQLL